MGIGILKVAATPIPGSQVFGGMVAGASGGTGGEYYGLPSTCSCQSAGVLDEVPHHRIGIIEGRVRSVINIWAADLLGARVS